ncbi:hypothetical protein MRB53_003394 [Persea americana]|uniref:Uncharacterized protein n=1 Tax=Persea americana TaxID=3435 RepID=A0ACC2MXG2_PERAE|nr:hypothetical protein MRB53_003394 [Persea americana]
MESMNYIAPTWYFNQGNELCFQTSIPHHTTIIPDVLPVHPSITREPSTVEPKRPALGATAPAVKDADDGENRCSKKRKIIHRDVERQRRQEMSMLYMLLKSKLPRDFLKGKRSISDHMNEAANYIKHLRKKIQELEEKRDLLRRVTLSSSNPKSTHCEGSSSSPQVTVRNTFAGAAVAVVGQQGQEVPLSRVIKALVEEGLNVISISTCINAQWVYSLECEGDDPRSIDSSGLQEILMDSICLSN